MENIFKFGLFHIFYEDAWNVIYKYTFLIVLIKNETTYYFLSCMRCNIKVAIPPSFNHKLNEQLMNIVRKMGHIGKPLQIGLILHSLKSCMECSIIVCILSSFNQKLNKLLLFKLHEM